MRIVRQTLVLFCLWMSMMASILWADEFHQDLLWLRTLHYKRTAFGSLKSELDDAKFFLSRDGRSNPEAEYLAFIDLLKKGEVPTSDDHALCRFPLRFRRVASHLGYDLSKIDQRACKKLSDYRVRMKSDGVSLVFSSFYLNNPSSAFGHSLLTFHSTRYRKKDQFERNELLDVGVNYAANPWTKNPLLYAVLGMAGGFEGSFAAIPYYFKVREYNNYESRDLWSYELDLTQQEIDDLVDHFWELGNTRPSYYYFTQNCSYLMLTALEAAAPRLKLSHHYQWYVIPSDTIRVVHSAPGLVKSVQYRPSSRSVFFKRLEGLDQKKIDWVVDVNQKRDKSLLSSLEGSAIERATLLDIANSGLEMQEARDLADEGSEASQWRQELLLARASITEKTPEFKLNPEESQKPHLGHPVRRLGLGWGLNKEGRPWAPWSWRFAMHDLLDSSVGYPRGSTIEFATFDGRISLDSGKNQFDSIRIFKLETFTPKNRFSDYWSFQSRLGFERVWDQGCDRCFPLTVGGGVGKTYSLLGPDYWLVYAFLDGALRYSTGFDRANLRPEVGPRFGTILQLTDLSKLAISGAWRRSDSKVDPWSREFEFRFRKSWHPSFAIDLQISLRNTVQEWAISPLFYF